ncbi:MAG: ABC transporter permease subunit [Actinomycetota bacterium]|nr:ABC transporter permease subunit [Actinomycetota bacterium]
MASSGARLAWAGGSGPAAFVVVVLFGGALAGGAVTSVQPRPDGEVTLDAWRTVLADGAFHDALGFTFRTAVAATLVSAILAVGFAALLRHHRTFLRALFALPVPMPHLLIAVVAVVWLGAGGLIERLGVLPWTLVRDRAGLGVVLVYVYKEVPFLALLVLAVWGRGVDDLTEAAAVTGASPWQRLRWVVWPQIRMPLAVGSLIVAAFVLGAFEVPLLVGPTYPPMVAVYALRETQTVDLTGHARAAASLLTIAAATVALAVVAVRPVRRWRG